MNWFSIAVYLLLLIFISPFFGAYMVNMLNGSNCFLGEIVKPVELFIYRIAWIDPKEEMDWKKYTQSLCIFSVVGFFIVFLIQVNQSKLPFFLPENSKDVPWLLALNTAISFVTNTNWQAYSGENTMGYLTQMLGLAVQNFVSAATGIAVLLALIRGIARKETRGIGNYWVDITRATLYILLPLSIVLALLLLSQGVIQNLAPYVDVVGLEGAQQVLPMGPAASQIAIKQLGTNGGGFFGVNSAHPFENPTPLSNFLEMFAILLLPSALVFLFGSMTQAKRHAAILYGVMFSILIVALGVSFWSESMPNRSLGLQLALEGKEVRFGLSDSILWGVTTTAASNGSVNAMHDSFSPLAGGMALFQMLLGEVVFGGVGSGLYGMLLFVLLTVFFSGLMVGRTPEYMGKKIEAFEIQMVLLAILLPSAVVLIGAGLSCVLPSPLASLGNPGPHGLSEILYAFASAANNNGSAFGGLQTNTAYYNVWLGIAMLVGRFGVIIPVLAIAGSLANKKKTPVSVSTLEIDTPLFGFLLAGVLLLVGALTFLPVLMLGPIVEHYLMLLGKTF